MRIEFRRHQPASPWTYLDLDRRQREVRDAVLSGGEGALLASEVAPVVTLGMRDTREDLKISETELSRRGISIATVTRGGRATYHGPGQWVIFPVDSLERLTGDRRGVRKLVESMLETAAGLYRVSIPSVEIRGGKEAGVWSGPGAGASKLAALGIRIDDGVVQHGIALNVFPTPESFAGIRPCGLDSPVGFLLAAPNEAEFVRFGEAAVAAYSQRFVR